MLLKFILFAFLIQFSISEAQKAPDATVPPSAADTKQPQQPQQPQPQQFMSGKLNLADSVRPFQVSQLEGKWFEYASTENVHMAYEKNCACLSPSFTVQPGTTNISFMMECFNQTLNRPVMAKGTVTQLHENYPGAFFVEIKESNTSINMVEKQKEQQQQIDKEKANDPKLQPLQRTNFVVWKYENNAMLVAAPRSDAMWILSRSSSMDKNLLDQFVQEARNRGFDVRRSPAPCPGQAQPVQPSTQPSTQPSKPTEEIPVNVTVIPNVTMTHQPVKPKVNVESQPQPQPTVHITHERPVERPVNVTIFPNITVSPPAPKPVDITVTPPAPKPVNVTVSDVSKESAPAPKTAVNVTTVPTPIHISNITTASPASSAITTAPAPSEITTVSSAPTSAKPVNVTVSPNITLSQPKPAAPAPAPMSQPQPSVTVTKEHEKREKIVSPSPTNVTVVPHITVPPPNVTMTAPTSPAVNIVHEQAPSVRQPANITVLPNITVASQPAQPNITVKTP